MQIQDLVEVALLDAAPHALELGPVEDAHLMPCSGAAAASPLTAPAATTAQPNVPPPALSRASRCAGGGAAAGCHGFISPPIKRICLNVSTKRIYSGIYVVGSI